MISTCDEVRVAKVKQQQAEEAAHRHFGGVCPRGLSGCGGGGGGAHPARSTHNRAADSLSMVALTSFSLSHSLALGAHPPPTAQPPPRATPRAPPPPPPRALWLYLLQISCLINANLACFSRLQFSYQRNFHCWLTNFGFSLKFADAAREVFAFIDFAQGMVFRSALDHQEAHQWAPSSCIWRLECSA
jgi:hypothetical protein